MSGRQFPSPNNNKRNDGARRPNNYHHSRPASINGPGQQRRHPNNDMPPPYSRVSHHDNRRREPAGHPAQKIHVASLQRQPAHSSNANRGTSFAERRKLQEQREFDRSFAFSATGTDVNTNGGDVLRSQNIGGAKAAGTMSSKPTSDDTNSTNLTDLRSTQEKTSINLANYDFSGKRLGSTTHQQFVVVNKNNSAPAAAENGGVSNTGASSSAAPSNTAPTTKPSSILKRSSSRPASILKTPSRSSFQTTQSATNQKQQSKQQGSTMMSKVDWGDNSTREIESRISPVPASFNNNNYHPMNISNNYMRQNSNDSTSSYQNNNVQPNNHSFHRDMGGGEHPLSPPNNVAFHRSNSGGSVGNNTGSRPKFGFNQPCRIAQHKGSHLWKDCPNNPHSEHYNGISFKTASHQQLVQSMMQFEMKRQQKQIQQQQKKSKQQQQRQLQQEQQKGQVAGTKRPLPPPVVAASSLKRPAIASKSNPNAAVAAARRKDSEGSNLFNTTKSARTPASNQHHLKPHVPAGSSIIPKKKPSAQQETQKLRNLKQTTELHSSTVHGIPRKQQQQQQTKKQKQKPKKAEPRKEHQRNVEFKNGRFQRRTSNNMAPSGQDAVPIEKQTSGRLVTKAKKPSATMRRQDSTDSAVQHRNKKKNTPRMEYDTDESHHTLMDDEVVEIDDFGTFGLEDNEDDNGDEKKKAAQAPHSNITNVDFTVTRDPKKNNGQKSKKEKKDSSATALSISNNADGAIPKVPKKAAPTNTEKNEKKKKKKQKQQQEKVSAATHPDGGNVGSKNQIVLSKKKAAAPEKKEKAPPANSTEVTKPRNEAAKKSMPAKEKKSNTNVDKDDKQPNADDKIAEKKKKKKKSKICKKPGCSSHRLKGKKFCKDHSTITAPAASVGDGTGKLSTKPTKPSALASTENVPRLEHKANKHGVKRKAPSEPTVVMTSSVRDRDVSKTVTLSSNKRKTAEHHRNDDTNNRTEQSKGNQDTNLLDLGDAELAEMESDLFNLLDESIKVCYGDYIERNKIDKDALSEEQAKLKNSEEEHTHLSDEISLSKEPPPPTDDFGTANKENMSSELQNTLTDSMSMATEGDSEDDEQIPLFYTCDKCDRVFFAKSQVEDHENKCTKDTNGRIFTNPNDIAEYYEKYHVRGELKPDCVIFYRPPVTSPCENSGRTISPEDFERRSGKKNELQQNLIDKFTSSVSPKTTSTTKKNANTNFQVDSNNSRHTCMVMNAVEHLSSTVIDGNSGLPSQTITTLCSETETLYEFRVEIKPSKIPNSGLGAFLTFVGARHLTKAASERCSRLLSEHRTYDENGDLFVKTHEELTAEVFGGRKMRVTLKGDNLHHNDNSLYWSKERQEYLTRHIEEHGTILDHFDEDEICCKVNSEVKKYRSKTPAGERIGFLGIHSESDYLEDKNAVFSSEKKGLGMLELGRYGPHRRVDVKDNLHFDFKTFVYGFEPSEWSYGVSEQRLGRDQAVDITDDATGQVHSLARKNTPIYVNEVGHDKKLHCNVDIRDANGCSVYYYIFIDKNHAMKAGDEVELLVDYGEAYEDVRERKGYGKDNNEMNGGDDDDAARLKRNFIDREQVQMDIADLKFYDLFYLVEYLTNEVLIPTDEKIQNFANGQVDSFTSLSKAIIARQRLDWLKTKLQCRLKEIMTNADQNDVLLLRAMTEGGREMVTTVENSLLSWEFSMLPALFVFLRGVSNGNNKTLQDVILAEVSEELLYSVAFKLPDPLQRTSWSKICGDLTENVARAIARYIICSKIVRTESTKALAEQLYTDAKNAAERVREASKNVNTNNSERDTAMEELSFRSARRKMKKKDVTPNGVPINAYSTDLNIQSGTAATIADIQAYQDAVELGFLDPYFEPSSSRKLSDSEFSIVSKYASGDGNGRQQFHWMPRSIDAFKNGVAHVNELWYLLNQVLLPVYTLSTCVEWPAEFQLFSLEKMCEAIGISLEDAKETLQRGVAKPNWPESDNASENVTKTKKKKRLRGATRTSRTLGNHPCEEFPGWTVERVQRQTSQHVDSYWSHPELSGIVVRSRIGVKEMIAKMTTNLIDAKTAYDILMSEGKKKFFGGRKS